MILKKIKKKNLIIIIFCLFLFICVIVRNRIVLYYEFACPRYFDIIYNNTETECLKDFDFNSIANEKIRVTDKEKVKKVTDMIKSLPFKKVNAELNEDFLNSKVEVYLKFTTRKNDSEEINIEEYNKEYFVGNTILLNMIILENKKVIITLKRPYVYKLVRFVAPISYDNLELIKQETLPLK